MLRKSIQDGCDAEIMLTMCCRGTLPPNKLKLAKDTLTSLITRLKPMNTIFIQAVPGPDLHRKSICKIA